MAQLGFFRNVTISNVFGSVLHAAGTAAHAALCSSWETDPQGYDPTLHGVFTRGAGCTVDVGHAAQCTHTNCTDVDTGAIVDDAHCDAQDRSTRRRRLVRQPPRCICRGIMQRSERPRSGYPVSTRRVFMCN